mmetsp:Transcript_44613/g.132063  ORF Transcript_44613/g.132063 Transcript_44613/m.132063 type:complete len:166 (+) Transcript_44613:104-601(+)
MSRHAYGPAWHQGYMRPNVTGGVTGEADKKKVPPGGSGFSGVPNDFPPEKLRWYMNKDYAAGSHAGPHKFSASKGASMFGQEPSPVATAIDIAVRTHPATLHTQHLGETLHKERSFAENWSDKERSHGYLHYGRSRPPPETLRTAGMGSFAARRFHETNAAIPLT